MCALKLLAVIGGIAASTPAVVSGAEAVGDEWQQVVIGGGGYVLQTHFHPTTAHTYLRTDVGGIYRREIDANAPGGCVVLISYSLVAFTLPLPQERFHCKSNTSAFFW